MQVYIMGVAIVTDRLTPGLLMTYSMTMMEVRSQLQRRKGVAFTKAFMVSCVCMSVCLFSILRYFRVSRHTTISSAVVGNALLPWAAAASVCPSPLVGSTGTFSCELLANIRQRTQLRRRLQIRLHTRRLRVHRWLRSLRWQQWRLRRFSSAGAAMNMATGRATARCC